jgi:pimeloyl-ACP methyl ester carboxylesterase
MSLMRWARLGRFAVVALPVALLVAAASRFALVPRPMSGTSERAPRWNDGWPTAPGDEPPDDLRFLAALIDALVAELGVDRGRVFAAGFSNGASIVYRLACERPELVAAAAPVAGALPRQASRCAGIRRRTSTVLARPAEPTPRRSGAPLVRLRALLWALDASADRRSDFNGIGRGRDHERAVIPP